MRAYQVDARSPINPNDIGKISRSESRRRYFGLVSGIEESSLDEAAIRSYRRDVQELIAKEIGDFQVAKTHNATVSPFGERLIFPEFTRCAVYLVRNPVDVVDSLADHNGLSIKDAIKLMNDPGHQIGGPGDPFVTQFLGTWSDHVRSWTQQDSFPVLIVRYEDLKQNAIAVFTQVLRFIGWPVDHQRIARANEYCSFEHLQEFEMRNGFGELSDRSVSGKFFREGRVGTGKKRLTSEQAEQINAHHEAVIQQLKYC
ncbi:aryl sulfotransferase [Rhodopirellula islandica]|uniref:Aryl sulfotransferase n=1 Tax=Rhodopirellula islandica TaxID=595434 RepID=A0A0J1E9U3_RHOIS|nr:aryl sulfotransferase [Rhodopirellula islandica]